MKVLLYSKTGRLAGFSSPSLSFFLNKKSCKLPTVLTFIFKNWIIVISSEKAKVIVCFPMSVLRETITHLTVKFSFRYCEV